MYYKIILILILFNFAVDNQNLNTKNLQKNKSDCGSSPYFKELNNPFSNEVIISKPENLKEIAQKTLTLIKNFEKKRNQNIDSKVFKSQNDYLKSVKNTLNFLIKIINSKQTISTELLNSDFHCIKWNGDNKTAKSDALKLKPWQIFLTKYLIYEVDGSYIKTPKYQYPLYATPLDEKNFSKKEINEKKDSLLRFRYSKEEVFNGALNKKEYKKILKPLVWLTKNNVEEAILQGTIIVRMPDGKKRIFNFAKNNGMAYDRKIKNISNQKSYGFFKEIKQLPTDTRLPIHVVPWVTFAGDIKNVGLGQFIVIRYLNTKTNKYELRLGILADTGGAFKDNLYQLDLYTGIYKSKEEFTQKTKSIPNRVEAFILVKKPC